MKVWALMGASAAVAMLSAAACTVEISDDDGGVGGAGGAADGGGGTTSQGGSGGTTSQGGAGGTGQGGSGGASCDTCNGFVTGDGPIAGRFCGENMDLTCEPNTSCEAFALLYDCVCEGSGQGGGGGAGGGGTCAAECQASLCNIQPLDAACENCLIQDVGGTCGGLYSACLAN